MPPNSVEEDDDDDALHNIHVAKRMRHGSDVRKKA